MDTQHIHTKTVTEVFGSLGDFFIDCTSDMNADETTTPELFRSKVIQQPQTIIDNVPCEQGALALSYVGDRVGELNEGNLTIDLTNDDVQRYERGGTDDIDLVYNED